MEKDASGSSARNRERFARLGKKEPEASFSIFQPPQNRFLLSAPEQNRTETVQNRTGRQFKTGFLIFGDSIGWWSVPCKGSSGVACRIRHCWRATGAAGFAKGAFASGPRAGSMPARGPNRQPSSPLASCVKLRGFGGWPPLRMDGNGKAGCRLPPALILEA
jgi:hypothetical protein